jgi:hypothetical protein
MAQYYSNRLAFRENFSLIHLGGKLTHQYIVDAYLKIEANRLNWIKQNQKELMVDSYKGVNDFVLNHANLSNCSIGRVIILPSTFTGGPRNMQQSYQDAMAMVRKFGKPDLFITFTCNPNWKEIKENKKENQQPQDLPHLIARVFKQKLNHLIDDIRKGQIFGAVLALVYVVEFQKRGLPHAHILLILDKNDKIREIEEIDKLISAELPDPNDVQQKRLFEIVSTQLIHGPCGADNPECVCMVEGKCSKGFPKSYRDETNPNHNGYPLYKRRDNGVHFKRIINQKEIKVFSLNFNNKINKLYLTYFYR